MIILVFYDFGILLFSDYFEFEMLDVFGQLKYYARVLIGDRKHMCIETEDPITPNLTMIRIEVLNADENLVGLYRIGLAFGEQLTIRQVIDGEFLRFDYVGPEYETSDESEQSSDSGNDQDTDDDVFNMNFD